MRPLSLVPGWRRPRTTKISLYALAFAQSHLGDDAQALQLLDRIAAGGPELTKAKEALRSSIFRKQGRPAEAVAALDVLLAVDPVHVDTLLLRASIMETMGLPNEQEISLKRAFDADPAKSAVPLSSFYLRAGRFDEAAAVADSALRT